MPPKKAKVKKAVAKKGGTKKAGGKERDPWLGRTRALWEQFEFELRQRDGNPTTMEDLRGEWVQFDAVGKKAEFARVKDIYVDRGLPSTWPDTDARVDGDSDAEGPEQPDEAGNRAQGSLEPVAETRRSSLRTRRLLELDPPGGDYSEYVGKCAIGEGGFGTAAIWVAFGENGIISKLMAVKDTYVAPQYWNHIAHWYGDIRNTDTRVHQEVKAMQNLSNVPDVDNVVGYIGSSVDNATCSYRLYMEYCPLGDLWYSMWTHLDYEDEKSDTIINRRYIPEPAIWCMFEGLLEACLAMEQGGVNSAQPGWERIIHRDFKPNNVFLAEPEGTWLSYPRVKVGDFGAAIITHDNDMLNPLTYNDGNEQVPQGTPGHQAPEQLRPPSTENEDMTELPKLRSWTNIWAVGNIVKHLMELEDEAKPTKLRFTGKDTEPKWNTQTRTRYTKNLYDLVESCVRFNPEVRIPIQDLYDAIQECTQEDGLNLAKGMRSGPPIEMGHKFFMGRKVQQYTVGLAFVPNQ